jgi:hypothetical protein
VPEHEPHARRLLILSCSRCKRADGGLLPAIQRYDGPAFRVLRRFLREGQSEAPDVRILSAEHGLIPHYRSIPYYDRIMTLSRARELRPGVREELTRIASRGPPRETFVFAGQTYLVALCAEGMPRFLERAQLGVGAPGGRLAGLRDWLWRETPLLSYNSSMPARRGRQRIRGVEVSLTAVQALGIARRALDEDWGNPDRYESWSVPVDGRCVAPKWLVSRITGLPVGAFSTDEARRLLARLGVEVRRHRRTGSPAP